MFKSSAFGQNLCVLFLYGKSRCLFSGLQPSISLTGMMDGRYWSWIAYACLSVRCQILLQALARTKFPGNCQSLLLSDFRVSGICGSNILTLIIKMLTLQISLSHPVPSELWFYGRDLLNLSITPLFMSLRYWIWYHEHSVKNWSFLKAYQRPPHMTHSGTCQTYLTRMDFLFPEWKESFYSIHKEFM